MKVKHTVAVIVFVGAIAAFIGLTATNTFAIPGIPILQQEQVKQETQSTQTIPQTDKSSVSDTNEVEDETEDEDSDEVDPRQASKARITAEQATEIAVKHVGVQLSDVKEVELEKENGRLQYSVELVKDGKMLAVEIDAITGSIITIEQDDDTNEAEEEETEAKDDAEDQDEVNPHQASQAQITAEEAKAIAVKAVGAQLSDIKEVELENHNGNLVYSIEIAKDGKLFEVEVDAITGTVMILEQDDDNGSEENETNEVEDEAETNEEASEQVNPKQASKSIISQQEAKEIAVKHIGAQLSDVKAVELETEGGKTIYSVEIVIDYKLVEVEIDATNGNVISVEHGDD